MLDKIRKYLIYLDMNTDFDGMSATEIIILCVSAIVGISALIGCIKLISMMDYSEITVGFTLTVIGLYIMSLIFSFLVGMVTCILVCSWVDCPKKEEGKKVTRPWKLDHPVVYPTVDCAIFEDGKFERVLLARKPGQFLYRFVGGFVDPSDETYVKAAIREAKEETGLDCSFHSYVGSRQVDDPRYAESEDKIMTTLVVLISDSPLKDAVAHDDIVEVKAFDFGEVEEEMLVPEHKPLLKMLKEVS